MEKENSLLLNKLKDTTSPTNIHNVGIYFKDFFNEDLIDYYELLLKDHQFQTLTESNKPSNAFRKGIYLTNVTYIEDTNDLKFNLLRCSSNLDGPTDNFRETDLKIINKVTEAAKEYFEKPFNLNHVLAQVYNNNVETSKKAKIKEHSDKTKDMDLSGIMAFCTFYNTKELQERSKQSQIDPYDYVYKNTSVLTTLKFRLKKCVTDNTLIKEFEIKLYPGSVFLMPLSTNRLYTHEICPSVLNVEQIPTRMGYVIRCSKTEAVHKDGKTYIINTDNSLTELIEPCEDEIIRLKDLYYNENTTADIIQYDGFNFSLNKGDYLAPII